MAERPSFDNTDWLEQVSEDVIDPERRIVDPHHHLWSRPERGDYLLPDLHADTGSGHLVTHTVFVECRAGYRTDGPDHLRPVGETEFVADIAHQSRIAEGAEIAGIVAHADLRGATLDEVLDAHEAAGDGLFRGIRHSGASDPDPDALTIAGRAPAGLYADEGFRQGVQRLGARDLTYDTWHYHHQNRDFLELARACPDTLIVLDHFGTPLGVGRFAGRHDDIHEQWKRDIADIARCENVVAKLGGLAMPDNGFGFHEQQRPPTSDEFVLAQERWYHHTIECFGPGRCMFESNFPVDRLSLSYLVLYNALKKMAARYSEAEQDAMFSGTAIRVYQLDA